MMKLTKKLAESLRTESQIAVQFNVPLSKLQYWRRHYKGPRFFKVGSKAVCYLEADVKRFLARYDRYTD